MATPRARVLMGTRGTAVQPVEPEPAKALQSLGLVLQPAVSVAKQSGSQKANLSAPKMHFVTQLAAGDYIAITDLRTCTALAVYDAQKDVSGAYHFGGHFGDEQAELDEFFLAFSKAGADAKGSLLFLSGSQKCQHVEKLLSYLRSKGLNQAPHVSESIASADGATVFYLLATGQIANALA